MAYHTSRIVPASNGNMVPWESSGWFSSWLREWKTDLWPSSSSSSSSSSAGLGKIWQAKQAVAAWCNGEIKSVSGGGSGSERLRLVLCNPSNEDLVYSWVTPQGKIHGFRKLCAQGAPPPPPPNNRDAIAVLPEEPTIRGSATNQVQKKHVERTFLGHAFIFGRLQDPNGGTHIKKPEDIGDLSSEVIILGAYRPESLTASNKNKEKPAFPCHVLTLHPPPRSTSTTSTRTCGILCCPPSSRHPVWHFQKRPKRKPKPSDNPTKRTEFYVADCSWTISVQEAAEPSDAELLDTTKTQHYVQTHLCGWPVFLEQGCFDNDNDSETGQELRRQFCRDLQYALDHLPSHALDQLRKVPCCIWINKCGLSYGPAEAPETLRSLCFHPGADWLVDNRMHVEKNKCVEVYDVQHYCHSDRHYWGTGGVLLHELSHAYHNTCLPNGYDNMEIQECYQKAMDEQLYCQVRVHGPQGPTAKAYACENAMEYFAELSTAFLGGVGDQADEEYNKWYPFNRAQLKQHDPRAYALLHKLWKVPLNDDTDADNGLP